MSNSIFGIAERGLQLAEERSVLITNNLVNSSTPNYKARDIDFHQALASASNANSSSLTKTNAMHLSAADDFGGETLMYRIPMQKSLDGNTVDPEVERKNFIENAMRYQVSLTFIQNKSDEIHKAIKGE